MSNTAEAIGENGDARGRGSVWVFTGILLLVLLAVAFPQMAPQGLQGILWAGSGFLMLLWPPVVRVPRLWALLAAGFVAFSLLGFLPREWFPFSSWRGDLETLGLATGTRAYVQPGLAAEMMAGFAATTLVVLFLLGHRVGSRDHQRLALGFVIGVGAWATAALLVHVPGRSFGFFPNRNHAATLLVMGTFAGLGCLAHAIRRKDLWKIPLSVIPTIVCLYALHAVSISRAGLVLVLAGFVLWVLLTGLRHLQGSVGKALVLLLVAAVGAFLVVDSTAKKRLTDSIEQISVVLPMSNDTRENPFSTAVNAQEAPATDGRIAIFRDTFQMIRHESWTGVGPGQFAQVFPQYRENTNAPKDAKCLHPESDWLMMVAETGWPATLCLAAGVLSVFWTSVVQVRRGRARFLRMGCVVAAMLLALHGIFDVPGHRVGLAWAGAFLLAASLRSPAVDGFELGPSRLASHCWRGLGGVLALAGVFLIHAQSTQRTFLPSVQVSQAMSDANRLYDQDKAAYDLAKAEGRDYQPAPSEDPLEVALLKVNQAIDVTPLDPYLHHVRGSLALHYDDKQAVAQGSFAIQRRLEPTRVNLPLEQARAWNMQDMDQVVALWKEALGRASAEESLHPGSPVGRAGTYQRVLAMAGKSEPAAAAALDLAGECPSLLALWANYAPVPLLDLEMPRLLSLPALATAQKSLFEIWKKRGSKDKAAEFTKAHPELDLSSP